MIAKLHISMTLCALALSACSQSSVDIERERASLLAAADAYHELSHQSEWTRLIESDAEGVIILPPNAPRIVGLEDARVFFEAASGIELRYGDVIADVSDSGDMGYTLTDGVLRFKDPDGNTLEDTIRDFHLWTKQDGEWKIAVDIWSSEQPMPTAIN